MMKIGTIFRNCKILFISFFGMMMVIQLPSTQASEDHSGDQILLELALHKISLKYDVHFNYDRDIMKEVMVDYEEDNAFSLTEALDHVFESTHFGYRIFEERYIVVFENNDEGTESLKNMINHIQDLVEERESVKKRMIQPAARLSTLSAKDLYHKRIIFNVSGTVTDETGEPLIGVNIQVKGSSKGTATDFDGRFTLEDIDENVVLVVSYVGYQTLEVSLDGKTSLEIIMSSDSQLLDEIVVVGYGTQKRTELTGAVSSASAEQFKNVPSTNLSDALAGRLPGLDIMSSGAGSGATSQLLMRGQRSFTASNDPLIILDGVPYYGDFDDIDPRNIESIDILKDAATTSIYGSQGANGVIIINTLRGQEEKTKISISAYGGRIIRYGDIPLMDAQQYAEKAREGYRAVGSYPIGVSEKEDEVIFDAIELETIRSGSKGLNFQDIILRSGIQQNYNIAINGGSKFITYNVSGGYFDQGGIIPYDKFSRINLNANLDFKFSSRINAGVSLINGYSENSQKTINKIAQDFPGLTQSAITGQGGFLSQLYNADPAGKMYDSDGSPRLRLSSDGLVLNPMTDFEFDSYRFSSKRWRNFVNAFIEIKFLPKLTYKANFGTTLNTNKTGESAGYYSIITNMGNPIANIFNSFSNFNLYESILTYDQYFGIKDYHHITATVVQGFQKFKSEDNYVAVEDYPYETSRYYNLGSANTITSTNSDLSEWSQSSIAGRLFYGFDEKYLATLSLRIDGASQFAPGHKWGYFPSIAFAWRISQEKFLKSVESISDLKLRLSFGVSGNKAILPYQTQGKLSRSSYVFGDNSGFGYSPITLANPDLTWESTSVKNIGVDLGLINNRISMTVDLYDTETYDLLLYRKLPITTGFDEVLENVGKTQNRGIEIALNSFNVDKQFFRWKTNLSIYSNKTKIVSLFKGKEDDVGSGWFIGHPINVFYDFEKIGIWQLNEEEEAGIYGEVPGQIKVRDQNNDGKINGDDRIILGSPEPRAVISFFNEFNYKNWSLSFLAYTRLGGMIYASGLAPFAKKRYNGIHVDYWTPDNPTNGYPRPNQLYEGPGLYGETLGYRDGSYIMLKDFTIGYTIPKKMFYNLPFNNLNIYFSGKNLEYWTKSELREYNMRPDWNSGQVTTYPAVRTLVVGLNIDF